MIVDCHTHLMWYPDHVGEQYAREALASKLVKLKYSGGEAYGARLDLHSYDARPEEHWAASEPADRVVVFGLQAKAVGVWVPNEVIADYVRQHPEKLEGWASVDPNEPDCVEQLEHCVNDLGLKGLKLGPVYQHFDPQDRKHWPLFRKCQELGLPIMWHQGATFPSRARLSWGLPLRLEDIAMNFPDLKMIVAHLGHPWEEDLVVLIRKCPNVYTDISAVHYRCAGREVHPPFPLAVPVPRPRGRTPPPRPGRTARIPVWIGSSASTGRVGGAYPQAQAIGCAHMLAAGGGGGHRPAPYRRTPRAA